MGGGFRKTPVNMLGDVGCARRFQRRAIFAFGLCFTTALVSPLARADPARNGAVAWRGLPISAMALRPGPPGGAFPAIKIYFSRFCGR
jgi:hypothetical protein